jgi:hypothetical protein
VTDPGGFLSQWKVYLDQVSVGPEAQRFRGKKLDPTIFEKVRHQLTLHSFPPFISSCITFQLSEEQLGQM